MSKLHGKVLWFDERDGYGIIKGDDGHEYYTDISVTPYRQTLKRSTSVSFVINKNIKDCLCAKDVEIND